MRAAWVLVGLHALALGFGLFGILIAIPHPQLFAGSAFALAFYPHALNGAGSIAIVLGALAMLAFGLTALGPRPTLRFFIAATTISAAAELTGTATGWPFGGYAYTSFLGYELLGRVPAAIPLSWFTIGFAALVLAERIVRGRRLRPQAPLIVLVAALLLVAWDLVLDPSMAAPRMQYLHFWVWHERGPYFGMPLRNLAGWVGTGLAFIALGRPGRSASAAPLLPFVVYALNVGWSMAIALAAGLWPAALLGLALAIAPAVLALIAVPQPTLERA